MCQLYDRCRFFVLGCCFLAFFFPGSPRCRYHSLGIVLPKSTGKCRILLRRNECTIFFFAILGEVAALKSTLFALFNVSSVLLRFQSAVGDDKTRAKDRRSAKTGVRSGGRAPSSTVAGGAEHTGPDPMTYALEDGGDEEVGSQEDPEEEVVYQHHQVHPSIVNHSVPNRTQTHVDDTMSRYDAL